MIIVSGASRGIGQFLFNEYLRSGEEVLGTFNRTIPTANSDKFHKLDVTDSRAVTAFVEVTRPQLENLTLINCAGINYNSFGHKADVDRWKDVINVNLNGTFFFIRAVLPLMRDQNFGRIINLSSVVGEKGVPGTSAYAASKAALQGLVRPLAAENSSKGITINNINLGYFDIGMISEVPNSAMNQIVGQIPMNRLGDPSEILKTCEYLRVTPYVNGTSIDVNGGLF